MGTLGFTATTSLDGYVNDASGDFQWSVPSDEVFQSHIDRLTSIKVEILGRKTYQLMQYWEQDPEDDSWGDAEREFARLWRGIELVVVSSTLTDTDITGGRARLVSELSVEDVAEIVAATDGEVEIFGPTTAAPAIRAGLVQDFRFYVVPKLVGGGVRALPDDVTLDLQLVDSEHFGAGGPTFLHYWSRHSSGRSGTA